MVKVVVMVIVMMIMIDELGAVNGMRVGRRN
jgi:hypothetical protein